MKRFVYSILAFLLISTAAMAGDKPGRQSFVVGFYNLENLFDTYHDEGKNDYEYLPDGNNHWTEAKYEKKLHNMASVIKAMAEDNNTFHSILGVSEIENRHVLEDLVNQPEIMDANFQIVHFDGPDARGVDVALFYRPDHFKLEASESLPFTFEGSSFKDEIDSKMDAESQASFKTRDILMVRGLLGGERCAFFVAHLPSRLTTDSGYLRNRGAEIIYKRAMELEKEFPGIKIVVMGDMNDNPTDDSMSVYMHGRENIKDVAAGDFFSPFTSMLKAGYGSLAYRGTWNIYDIILVNHALVSGEGLQISQINKKGFYGRVFHKDFMTQQTGQYKDTPFRTFSNGQFVNGYSDHYPTYIVLSK